MIEHGGTHVRDVRRNLGDRKDGLAGDVVARRADPPPREFLRVRFSHHPLLNPGHSPPPLDRRLPGPLLLPRLVPPTRLTQIR